MTYLLTQVRIHRYEKTADISRRHLWFPSAMTSEKRAQKFHIDDQIWIALLIGWKFASSNQKH